VERERAREREGTTRFLYLLAHWSDLTLEEILYIYLVICMALFVLLWLLKITLNYELSSTLASTVWNGHMKEGTNISIKSAYIPHTCITINLTYLLHFHPPDWGQGLGFLS
jgi:hypothetical protein